MEKYPFMTPDDTVGKNSRKSSGGKRAVSGAAKRAGWTMLCLFLSLLFLLRMEASVRAEEDLSALVASEGKVWYTVEDGEILMRSLISLLDGPLSAEEAVALRDDVVRTLTTQAAMYMKYEELGLGQEDSEQTEQLRKTAGEAWEDAVRQMAEQLRENYGGNETDSLVTARALMKQIGMTEEVIYERALAQWRAGRLAEMVAGDLTVTEEELQEKYLADYVNMDREKYEGNIPAFEEEILFGEGTTSYFPEGYRLVEWILLSPAESTKEKLHAAVAEMDEAYEAASAAYAATFGYFEDDGELQTAKDAYNRALTAYGDAWGRAENIRQDVLEEAKETIAEIREKKEQGTSWDDLIRAYSSDRQTLESPFPIHTESGTVDAETIENVMSIPTVGEIGEPMVTEDGVLMYCWVQEAASGPLEMSDESRKALEQALLSQKQEEIIGRMAVEWATEYHIRCWPERLKVPQSSAGN